MSQIEITNDDHTVKVEHAGADLSYVIDQARKLWEDTRATPRARGSATGFSSQIAPQWNHDRTRPVRAEETS